MRIDEISFNPVGTHKSLASTGLSTQVASTFTSLNQGENKILIQALNQNVRYTLDNATSPTSILGLRLTAGNDPIIIPIGKGSGLKVIAETAGATLEYQYGV